ALRQRLPQIMPIPTGGRETVNQQQRLAMARDPIPDGMAAKHERLAVLAPDAQGNLGKRHQVLYPGSCRSSLRSSAGQASAPPMPWALLVTPAIIARAPASICGSMAISSAPPFWASTWMSQVR